jgi:hypothetical protein
MLRKPLVQVLIRLLMKARAAPIYKRPCSLFRYISVTCDMYA